jgi:hypothetical protein
MKNRYNWAQVADIYCKELGITYPRMEEYLRGIYSDLPIAELEDDIKKLAQATIQKSEYFPDMYVCS